MTVSAPWSIVAVGDFDGDGKADILFRSSDNTTQIWFMNGPRIIGRSPVMGEDGPTLTTPRSAERTAGVQAYFNDVCPDLLFRSSDNTTQIWFMDGARFCGMIRLLAKYARSQFTTILRSSIVAVGDFDGDGKADILFRSSDNTTQIWFMNAQKVMGRSPVIGEIGPVLAGPPWSIVGTGDFNSDGKDDLLWHNTATNETKIWFI